MRKNNRVTPINTPEVDNNSKNVEEAQHKEAELEPTIQCEEGENTRDVPSNISQVDENLNKEQESQNSVTEPEHSIQNETAPKKRPEKKITEYKVGILSQFFYW